MLTKIPPRKAETNNNNRKNATTEEAESKGHPNVYTDLPSIPGQSSRQQTGRAK